MSEAPDDRVDDDKPVVVGLNHAVLFVADLDHSVDFYAEALRMEMVVRETRPSAAFLRLPHSGNHHDLGLFETGAGPKQRGVGLYHLAWQVATIDDLSVVRSTLKRMSAFTGESDHGATKSVYGVDPDGNEFEVMWMLPRREWNEFEHSAPILPLDLNGELGRWSGVDTSQR